MKLSYPCACAVLALLAMPAEAASGTETVGTVVAIALPVAAGGVALWKDDWTGIKQLVVVTGLTVGTAYGLKHLVREQRPDHSDFQSFPSDTGALAFAPAQFLWQRYGWKYGAPAYGAAALVAYSRIDAKRHHWWDVAASAGMSLAYNALITTRYRNEYGFSSSLDASPDSVYASLRYRW